jgi:hypothetical protein
MRGLAAARRGRGRTPVAPTVGAMGAGALLRHLRSERGVEFVNRSEPADSLPASSVPHTLWPTTANLTAG